MRRFVIASLFAIVINSCIGQKADSLIGQLTNVNAAISSKSCNAVDAMAISHRAMNVFLADKTAYLSGSSDLSYFTNYVTFNSSTGLLTVNHNFQTPTGKDDPLKRLFSVGLKVNAANALLSSFSNTKYQNELGLTLTQTFIGKTKTKFKDCTSEANGLNQKQAMDVLRQSLVKQLEQEIKAKEAAFNATLDSVANKFGSSKAVAAAALAKQNFYDLLADEYNEKFAMAQAELLTQTNNFSVITSHWTTVTAYVPLSFPRYQVAPALNAKLQEKHPYPFEISLSHTRMWEASKWGRLFVSLYGKLLLNSSPHSRLIDKYSPNQYLLQGGKDTTGLISQNYNEVYAGAFQTFATPSASARIVYFSKDSHVGLSVSVEQSFGKYNALSGTLGIPIILINSRRTPAVNIEVQVSFADITNNIAALPKGNKKTVGIAVGIPLSRLMY